MCACLAISVPRLAFGLIWSSELPPRWAGAGDSSAASGGSCSLQDLEAFDLFFYCSSPRGCVPRSLSCMHVAGEFVDLMIIGQYLESCGAVLTICCTSNVF